MTTDMVRPSILPSTPSGLFTNEPFTNFSAPENKRAMETALESVAQQLGREYELVIGGEQIKTAERINSINPAQPTRIVGIHQKAGAEHAAKAIAAAQNAFASWSKTSTELRVSLLL